MKRYASITLSAAIMALFCLNTEAQIKSPAASTPALPFVMGNNLTIKNTQLPFEKKVPNVATSVAASGLSAPESKPREERGMMRAPAINDTETWSDWSIIGSATYQHGNSKLVLNGGEESFKTNVYQRYSTVSGHSNLFQLKVEKAFGGKYDAIFWYEPSDEIAWDELSGEPIDMAYTIEGYSYAFKSIVFDKASFNPNTGEMVFRTWYSINGADETPYGFAVYDTVQLDNMPTYDFTLQTDKTVYTPEDRQATVSITHSDNIGSVRYYMLPESDTEFTGVPFELTEAEFVQCPYTTLDASATSFNINIVGYQNDRIYVQFLNTRGRPVQYAVATVFSTQEDGRSWESIGYGDFADKSLKSLFSDEVTEAETWKVVVQQCTNDKSLYRLLNPYTNGNCPYSKYTLKSSLSGKYKYEADPQIDYYVYFKVNNNDLTVGNSVASYSYPSGAYLRETATGNRLPIYAQQFNTVSQDNMVASDDNTFTMPGYTDFTFTVSFTDTNVVAITPATPGTDIRFKVEDMYGNALVPLEPVPDNLVINLNEEYLDSQTEYKLTISSYNLDGIERNTETIFFNLSMSNWEYVGTGNYNYNAYYHFTVPHDLYRRHELKDENHEQYRLDGWCFSPNNNLIIDIPDKTQVDDNGRIYIHVSPTATNINDINTDAYGNIYAVDAYNYTNNEQLLNSSYFVPVLGELQLYLVYYVSGGYLAADYETYKLDGYPNVELIDNNLTQTDEGYQQSVIINVENVAYAKYAVFDNSQYNASDAITALGNLEDGVTTITQPTAIYWSTPGNYILALTAYNKANEAIISQWFAFSVPENIDLNDWTYIGKSRIVDNWITPRFLNTGETNINYAWEVDTYAKADDNNIVGLYNPYSVEAFPFITKNQNNVGDAMVTIDLSDSSFILINEQYSGFKYGAYGSLRIGNYEGFLYSNFPSKDFINMQMEAYGLAKTTISDFNVITIPTGLYGYSGGSFGYTWSTEQGFITLPADYSAVHDVIVNSEDSDAPAEYFNLQGIRVTNPEHGVYILRQGAKAIKIVK
jgi:hypothetical protein